jgi:hypothetical protein
LTGERYFRPGGELYRSFDNPKYDEDFEVTKTFKAFLRDLIENDINELGLNLSCDSYLASQKALYAREIQRLTVEEKVMDLQNKFKIYNYPNADSREPMRPTRLTSKRPPIRPFIIPKHWHNDI